MTQRIGWWLALEPIGPAAVAWSLIRVDDTPPVGPIGAGLQSEVADLRALVASLPPRGRRAEELWSGPLVDPGQEVAAAVRLGQALLPDALRRELLATDLRRVRHTVSVACRGWLAQVPWEVVALDGTGDVRLVERARVASGLSPTINAGRRRAPAPRPDAPALRVLDPGSRSDPQYAPVYAGYPLDWDDVLADREDLVPDGRSLSAARLGELLRAGTGWSRFLYFGHCRSGTAETPAGAALVLSHAGMTELFTAHAWLKAPDTWPCPARVALIACGSDDSVHLEQSGLPVAAVNAGAELLTVTRWTLPLDLAPPEEAATTALALAVDAAHRSADPLEALAGWQRQRLTRWRAGADRSASPLLWGSLATYVVPAMAPEDLRTP